MQQQKSIRDKYLSFRLNQEEYDELQRLFKNTTCPQLSDYVRRIVLKMPINIKYRNTSADDFLTEMLALKKELSAIGNNFNQSVHKLHTLDHLPEFRAWAQKNEVDKAILFGKIDNIMNRVNEIYKQWFQ